jgi:hypothetical protein
MIMKRIALLAALVSAGALTAAACSSDEKHQTADCAKIMAALRTPAQVKPTDTTIGPMYERAAADLRGARSEIESDELLKQTDIMIKELEAVGKDVRTHPESGKRLGDPYYQAEREITSRCGPLHPA